MATGADDSIDCCFGGRVIGSGGARRRRRALLGLLRSLANYARARVRRGCVRHSAVSVAPSALRNLVGDVFCSCRSVSALRFREIRDRRKRCLHMCMYAEPPLSGLALVSAPLGLKVWALPWGGGLQL